MEKIRKTSVENNFETKDLFTQILMPAPQTITEEVERAKRIFLASPHMSSEGFEQEYVKEAFDTNWIAPVGKNLDNFEIRVADAVGSKHAIATTSGTAALHLAVKALGIEQGDIVFVQSLTFVASLNAVLYEGGIPVLIDSERDTWNMDPQLLEEAFQKYSPKAVMVVHLYGNAAKMDEIKAICDKYNTPIIEDAAEALGVHYNDQYVGTFGEYGVYSFNGNKIITTSGGGMLVTNNDEGSEKVKHLAAQAKDPAQYYQHSSVGFTYRMSNVLAGIGLGQLRVLRRRIRAKKEIYQIYQEAFAGMPEISMIPSYEGSNNWLSVMLINREEVTPLMVKDALEAENIESRFVWKPMHLQPLCSEFDVMDSGVSEDFFKRGLCLPSDTKMTDEEIDRVIDIVIKTITQ